MKEPAKYRLMSPDELQAVERMGAVTYPCGSWDKRFMRMLSGGDMITEKEVPQLWRLFIKYRRQMNFPDKQRLLDFAATHSAPDFRKLQAAQEKQAEINDLKAKYQAALQPTQPLDQ